MTLSPSFRRETARSPILAFSRRLWHRRSLNTNPVVVRSVAAARALEEALPLQRPRVPAYHRRGDVERFGDLRDRPPEAHRPPNLGPAFHRHLSLPSAILQDATPRTFPYPLLVANYHSPSFAAISEQGSPAGERSSLRPVQTRKPSTNACCSPKAGPTRQRGIVQNSNCIDRK